LTRRDIPPRTVLSPLITHPRLTPLAINRRLFCPPRGPPSMDCGPGNPLAQEFAIVYSPPPPPPRIDVLLPFAVPFGRFFSTQPGGLPRGSFFPPKLVFCPLRYFFLQASCPIFFLSFLEMVVHAPWIRNVPPHIPPAFSPLFPRVVLFTLSGWLFQSQAPVNGVFPPFFFPGFLFIAPVSVTAGNAVRQILDPLSLIQVFFLSSSLRSC